MAAIESALWQVHASSYDVLLKLEPYRRLVGVATNHLQRSLPDGARVLDLGCGTGNLTGSLLLARGDVSVVGVDAAPAMLARARAKLAPALRSGRLELVEAELDRWLATAPAGSFDALTMVNVLYTLPDPLGTLRAALAALAPGGTVLLTSFSDPAVLPIVREHVRLGGARAAARLVLPTSLLVLGLNLVIEELLRSGSYNLLPDDEVVSVLEEAGFEVLARQPVYGATGTLLVAHQVPSIDLRDPATSAAGAEAAATAPPPAGGGSTDHGG